MSEPWEFYEYGSAITDWLESLGDHADDFGDELWDLLQRLRLVERKEWVRPDFDVIDMGLSEIRLKPKGVNLQGRIYGYFGPHRKGYIMLVGATKKGTTHKPAAAKKTGKKRMQAVENDVSLIRTFRAG